MLRYYKDEWDEFEVNCGFTDVEEYVIKLYKKGWAIADVAAELDVSQSTVNRVIKRIKSKIEHYKSLKNDNNLIV